MEEQVEQVASDAPVFEGDEGGRSEYLVDPEGKTWRLIDGDYYCVSSDQEDNGGEAEEYDPVAWALLFQRAIRCFDPRFCGVSREQLAERRRKWAVKRAEMAREARTRAQSDQACRSRPEPTPVPRSRAVRTRRASTRSHATADPTPPPEPEPAAVSALARPPASPDTRVSALRGAADRVVGSLRTPRRDAVRLRCSASRRPPRSGAMLSLEQRLASFALTLASPSLSAALQAGVSARGHR